MRETRIKTKKLAEFGCLIAFAMIASYVEFLLPIPIGIPGAKLGLANVAIVYSLERIGPKGAIVINVSRILFCGLLFGNVYSLLYSLAGGIFSLGIMVILHKTKIFSIVGVSIAGGVAHNLGQLLLAIIITEVPVLLYYVPFLLVAGALTGLFNGWLARIALQRTSYIKEELG